MNRRLFLRNLVGAVAATAAVRTWPFRVYSFPSNIVIGDAQQFANGQLPFIRYTTFPGVLGLARIQAEHGDLAAQDKGVNAAVKAFLQGKYKQEADLRREEARAHLLV